MTWKPIKMLKQNCLELKIYNMQLLISTIILDASVDSLEEDIKLFKISLNQTKLKKDKSIIGPKILILIRKVYV